jgi:hypothetical protein
MRYADSLELATVETRLNALRAEKGERYTPARTLVQLAGTGGSFTGLPV